MQIGGDGSLNQIALGWRRGFGLIQKVPQVRDCFREHDSGGDPVLSKTVRRVGRGAIRASAGQSIGDLLPVVGGAAAGIDKGISPLLPSEPVIRPFLNPVGGSLQKRLSVSVPVSLPRASGVILLPRFVRPK